jgi:hypothetical protein
VEYIHSHFLGHKIPDAADKMWVDLGMDCNMPWQQVSSAWWYFSRLRWPGPVPKRIPPGLRCRVSQKQRTGWKLFQDTHPQERAAKLRYALQSLLGPDTAAFMELMLAEGQLHEVVEILESLWGKFQLPPEGQSQFLISF